MIVPTGVLKSVKSIQVEVQIFVTGVVKSAKRFEQFETVICCT